MNRRESNHVRMTERADRIAATLLSYATPYPADDVRDQCEFMTNGRLDCVELDILTDMVEARLYRATKETAEQLLNAADLNAEININMIGSGGLK